MPQATYIIPNTKLLVMFLTSSLSKRLQTSPLEQQQHVVSFQNDLHKTVAKYFYKAAESNRAVCYSVSMFCPF